MGRAPLSALVGSLFAVFMFLMAGRDTFVSNQQHDHFETTTETLRQRQLGKGNNKNKNKNYHTSKLSEKFQVAKAKFMEKLTEDYGPENVPHLFQTTTEEGDAVSIARRVFEGTSTSWSRMKRKVAMKILQAQIQEEHQPFVWATGGHSAAAGHGNLFNESYTAILELGSLPIFEAVGMNFSARNYAMGGTSSGMEIASCVKEVFGVDFDVLSWDYGMTTAVSSP